MPACGRFSARIRRAASSIVATAALLSAPRIVPPAFRPTPSSTTGSSAAVGGTVSRCAQRKIATPPFCDVAGRRARRLPASEPIRAPASSSSTSSARPARYVLTRSATARSWPGGLGIAASSVKSSSTSDMGRVYGVPLRSFADGHDRFGHLVGDGQIREREGEVIRLSAESAPILPEGVAAGEPESTLTLLATTRGRRHETPAARRRACRRDPAVRDRSGARGVGAERRGHLRLLRPAATTAPTTTTTTATSSTSPTSTSTSATVRG